MTREGIIVMAVAHGANTAFDHAEQLETFFHAAQKQAYERAAKVCAEYLDDPFLKGDAHICVAAIRALIEGEAK